MSNRWEKTGALLSWSVWLASRRVGTVKAYTRKSAHLQAKQQYGSAVTIEQMV